jgi:protein transport protein SEC61 subunit alpha
MIPTAAMLGGIVIGFLTVVGDLLNVAGSSTGIMLSISILYGYYEKIRPAEKIVEDF